MAASPAELNLFKHYACLLKDLIGNAFGRQSGEYLTASSQLDALLDALENE